MHEPAQMPDKTAAVRITAVDNISSLRLTSWLPEYTAGGKSVTLAGRELPSQVGGVLRGPMRFLCVGPAEWLIVSHQHHAMIVRHEIEPDLPKHGFALVDLTDGLAKLEIRGSAAREVLSKGCGLDFHPRTFPPGRCARTRFAQIPLVIDCLDEEPLFELYVARSSFQYLHSWLIDAAAEFQGP